MMTRETDSLADAVMNALWFPEWYRPTASPGRTQPREEINAGKLAREYVRFIILVLPLTYEPDTFFFRLAFGNAVFQGPGLGHKPASRRRSSSFLSPSTSRRKPEMLKSFLISSHILTLGATLQVSTFFFLLSSFLC
jgi:hypothetical protein